MHVKTPAAAAAASLLFCLGFSLASVSVAGAAGVPAYIRNSEIAQAAIPRSGGDTIDSLSLTALGRRFDLVLTPSTVLAEGAETILVDASGAHRGPRQKTTYRGHLADDAKAEVRVSIVDGAVDGYVRRDGETYFLEPLSRYQSGAAGKTLVYRESDIDAAALPPGTCAAEGQAPGRSSSSLRPRGDGGGASGGGMAGLGLLELTLVADYQMFLLHGGDTADYMLGIINQVDGFYVADLNVTLEVTGTVIYTSPGADPFSATTNPSSLLVELQNQRAMGGALGGGGATHLFTGRDLSGSVIGIAYLSSICDSTFGVGLSENFALDNHLMSLLVGHELGHNFGAPHDGQSGSACVAEAYGYVMWPSLASDLTEAFSPCSKTMITPVVDGASCINSAIPPGCGDGNLDPGEDCDDGGNESGDCCRVNCQYDSPGVYCATDSDECTDDVCNGAGLCQHQFNTAPCDDGDICTFDGQCTAGVCTPQGNVRPLEKLKFKAGFRPTPSTDGFALKANFLAYQLSSPPPVGGALIRISDAADAVLFESTVAAGLWLDAGGKGTNFRYKGDGLAPALSGMVAMSIKYNPATGQARLKAKVAKTDLALLQGQTALTLRLQIGDDLIGDCAQVVQVACRVQGTSLICP